METDLAEKLCGAWSLVSWRIEYDNGRPANEPFGADPVGLLLYDRSGWMSATMCTQRRSPFSAGSAAAASVASKARALDEYLAYSGRWRLEGRVIVHEVTCSLNPVLIGTEQRREAQLAGDRLDLSATESEVLNQRVKRRRHVIRWRRAEKSLK
jgi:hypothetical protein